MDHEGGYSTRGPDLLPNIKASTVALSYYHLMGLASCVADVVERTLDLLVACLPFLIVLLSSLLILYVAIERLECGTGALTFLGYLLLWPFLAFLVPVLSHLVVLVDSAQQCFVGPFMPRRPP